MAGYARDAATAFALLPLLSSAALADPSVRFVIRVPVTTPPHAPIFITGDHPALCAWRPDCVRLREIAPRIYAGSVTLPLVPGPVSAVPGFARHRATSTLHFKVTRGAWINEAGDERGRPMADIPVRVDPTKPEFVQSVLSWTDMPAPGVTGHLEVYRDVYSPQLGNHRRMEVWLPPDYLAHPDRRYPVVYLHDGQNLFDPATSYAGVTWNLDGTLTRMMAQNFPGAAILVGLDSTDDRDAEYDYTLHGAAYARFLIDTVKPMIDARYRTVPGREATFTMGSSMGALIALALAWKHSDVFSAAAAVSLPAGVNDNLAFRLVDGGPRPAFPIRLYMDHGTYGEDIGYGGPAKAFADHLRAIGFPPANLTYLVYPYADHTEADWARRGDTLLQWLLLQPPSIGVGARAPFSGPRFPALR